MKKLFLATESFPYGKSERTFILPELVRLKEHYDITILSHADQSQVQDGMTVKLPEEIRVVCLGRPQLTVANKIGAFLSFFIDRDGRMEMREILSGKENRRQRLYQSAAFFAQAAADLKNLRRSGILSDNMPALYYSFWYTYYCYSMMRERKRYPGIRIVARAHGVDLYHERVPGGRQPFRHQMEKNLDALVFACEYGKRYYEARVKDEPTDSGRLHVCRLGIEKPRQQIPADGAGIWRLLSCSHVIPLKRIRLIIDGLSCIEGAKISWTHIGDGSALEEMRQYAAEKLDAKDNIQYRFTGFVQDVRTYYETQPVDCFITTSQTEGGCPVSIQEAMSYGIPVIGTDVGGITEMIGDNGVLLSHDPGADEIAAAIQRIMELEESDLQRMKAASYQKWQEEFDIDETFGKLYAVLDR